MNNKTKDPSEAYSFSPENKKPAEERFRQKQKTKNKQSKPSFPKEFNLGAKSIGHCYGKDSM